MDQNQVRIAQLIFRKTQKVLVRTIEPDIERSEIVRES